MRCRPEVPDFLKRRLIRMKTIARISLLLLLAPAILFAAIHPTKAQGAYINEHEKCVNQLRDARKDAVQHDAAERKRLFDAAKQAYHRCEAHAHLVWKYYPVTPPGDTAPVNTSTGGAATAAKTTTR
jgi:hypothetical protein